MDEAEVAQADRQSAREEAEGLVRGLRERSAEACAELYDRYGPGIHRFAVTRLGDIQAAEDVVVFPVGQRGNLLICADRSRFELGMKLPNLGVGNRTLIPGKPTQFSIPMVEVHAIERCVIRIIAEPDRRPFGKPVGFQMLLDHRP